MTNNLAFFRLQADEQTPIAASSQSEGQSQIEVSETVSFIDNASGISVDAAPALNHVAKVDNTDDLQLGNFLSRPTLINTFTWSTADTTGVKSTSVPWSSFLQSAAIRKKIDNFAFIRGRLHVKVIVNGTPFQYGALRMCYSPLLGNVSDKIRTNLVSSVPLLVPYSQQPGFFIHPQANAGGEMVLPFFYQQNWLDLTSLNDVANFGTLKYVIYAPLRVAVTGGTSSVTVQTFAWMTDVELMGSTSLLSLQADEYQEGKISKPATALASIAGMLTSIPYIGPFARATEIGATAVGAMARLFGYTNVPVIENVSAYQPMNAPMLASAHIGTPVQKLTLDPKQELSIDPAPHGLESNDELALSYLKKKESYFATTSWSTSDATDAQLFNMRVNPYLPAWVPVNNSVAVPVGKRVYDIPLSYIGRMFKEWRGGLVLRIKVVATKFHKGRLKIQYDPRGDISTSAPVENTVYTTILDIGECDDLEVEIPYHQANAWATLDQTIQNNWTLGTSLAPRLGTDNGTLSIRVLNSLVAPTTGAVTLLFFLRAADDFEFANPAERIGPDTVNRVPNLYALQAEDHTEIVPSYVCVGTKAVVSDQRYGQNYGENIASLRTLLHRSQVMDTYSTGSFPPNVTGVLLKTLKIMPYPPGYNTNAPTTANAVIPPAGTANFSFGYMTHMPYISSMYLAYRGGANYTLTPQTDLYGNVGDFRVSRATSIPLATVYRLGGYNGSLPLAANNNARSKFFNYDRYTDGFGGMAITSTATNGSCTIQIPDYKKFNFSLADPVNYYAGSSKDGTDVQTVIVEMTQVNKGNDNIGGCTLQTEVCAAPDFTCLFFLCCPTLDFADAAPVPA